MSVLLILEKKNLHTFIPGLCVLLLVNVPQLDATVAVTIGSLALTAPMVTGIVALKGLALANGMTKKKTSQTNNRLQLYDSDY